MTREAPPTPPEVLVDALVDAGLATPETRPLLFEGLPPSVMAGLPTHTVPAHQLRRDVAELARSGPLDGHPDGPLPVWEANARRLLGEARRRRTRRRSAIAALAALAVVGLAFGLLTRRGPWPGPAPVPVTRVDGARLLVDRDEVDPRGWAWCGRTEAMPVESGGRSPSATGMSAEDAARCCHLRGMRLPTLAEFDALAATPPSALPAPPAGPRTVDAWFERLEAGDIRAGLHRLGTGAVEMVTGPDGGVLLMGQPTLPTAPPAVLDELAARAADTLHRVRTLSPAIYRGPEPWIGFRCVASAAD